MALPTVAEAVVDRRPWCDRAMRWAQLTLVDADSAPGSGYDVAEWLDYFRRIRANAACLSAGGYLAYYPTQVPSHRRSATLGDRDAFGELVRGCRELDMVVLARTDPHAIGEQIAEEHPEWVARDRDGQPRRHWSMDGVWLTCTLGDYATGFMPRVNHEIVTRYDVDGIFANRWQGSGDCYCDWCREAFENETGAPLPGDLSKPGPGRASYRRWREQRWFEIARLWDDEIRSAAPDARFVPNSGGGVLSEMDMSRLGSITDTLFFDRQARHGTTPVWRNGQYAKTYRAVMDDKPVGSIFSIGIEEPQRWKDSVQTEAEIRIWAASALANGARPWFTKFGGSIADPRWMPVIEELYKWQADIEPYLRNERSLARVAIVYSQQTAAHYEESASERVQAPTDGFYQALIEARIPFDMVHDRRLDAASLASYRTLVLPNIACLSDEQCQQLRQFVHAGGSLVATHETSRLDEIGRLRDGFGLGDLFGVEPTGPSRGPIKNSYLQLDPEARVPDVDRLLAGLGGTERIINGTNVVPVEASPAAASPVTLIDSFPDLPMEELYRRDLEQGPPQLFASTHGAGRVIYLPGDLDRTFWQTLAPDLGRLLANAVSWATNEPAPVEVEGQGIIELACWEQRGSMTVHLVNLTNPMMMKGPYRELIPAPPQRVRLQVPAEARVTAVRLLREGTTPRYEQIGDRLHVTVDHLEDIEILAVDLAG